MSAVFSLPILVYMAGYHHYLGRSGSRFEGVDGFRAGDTPTPAVSERPTFEWHV